MDKCSNKYVIFEIIALFIKKKLLKLSKKLRRKLYIQLRKKSHKLNKKTRKKTRDSIDRKLSKLDEEIRKKTNL